MRTEILLWSSISGAVLGAFTGICLIAAGVLLSAVVPDVASRALERLLPASLVFGLVMLPLAGAALGYLEGRLKLD